MTAPLPPLPLFSNTPILQAAFESMAKDYAKLAVREALERAKKKLEAERALRNDLMARAATAICYDVVRAMIEEYK